MTWIFIVVQRSAFPSGKQITAHCSGASGSISASQCTMTRYSNSVLQGFDPDMKKSCSLLRTLCHCGVCRSHEEELKQVTATVATQGAEIEQLQMELATAKQAAAFTAKKVAASLSQSSDSPRRESGDPSDGTLTQRQAALARLKAAAGGRQLSEDGSSRPEAAQVSPPTPDSQSARAAVPLGALSTASRPVMAADVHRSRSSTATPSMDAAARGPRASSTQVRSHRPILALYV